MLWLMSHSHTGTRPHLADVVSAWHVGEIAAQEAWLARLGVTMPPGWLPHDPRQRMLVVHGRTPPGG